MSLPFNIMATTGLHMSKTFNPFTFYMVVYYSRGIASVDIELTNIDINQCDPDTRSYSALDVFRGTHACPETTEVHVLLVILAFFFFSNFKVFFSH